MNKTELLLASKLLDDAASEYNEHGCNDYNLDNTPENQEFMNNAYKWNAGENGEVYEINFSPDNKEIYAMDYFLMSYCAYLLTQEANKTV
jgi:hypothetical protein